MDSGGKVDGDSANAPSAGPDIQADAACPNAPRFTQSIHGLIASGKQLAAAELAWFSLRATLLAKAARNIALLAVLALFLIFGLLVTLLVGGVMVLTPLIGVGWALTAICGLTILLIFGCALAIKGAVQKAKRMLK